MRNPPRRASLRARSTIWLAILSLGATTSLATNSDETYTDHTLPAYFPLPFDPLTLPEALLMLEFALLIEASTLDQSCVEQWVEYFQRLGSGELSPPRPTCLPIGDLQ
ncbi:MAG: hypothetical protein EA380_01345 [Phycisphaeraceae bacterium]|nr:MAG: hypothetical protein EA380_01345 [Phycisphaeraceae bacterium]